MIKLLRHSIVVLLVAAIVIPFAYPSQDETPQILFRNVQTLMEEGRTGRERGEFEPAAEKFRTASYLLRKVQQDFPDWNPQTVRQVAQACDAALAEITAPVPSPPAGPGEVSCVWTLLYPGPDFEPEEGGIYEITLGGEDREKLDFSFRKLKPYDGEARICVQLGNTSKTTVVQDVKNRGLFRDDSGSFRLKLVVPSGCPLFLARFTDDKYAPPRVLSNILRLP